MAVLDAKKTTQNLQSKGFIKSESHHHYFEFWHEDKLIVRTRTSHNNQDLNDYLISAMAKQCLMPKKFFKDFCRCTKSREEYISLLEENGEI